MPSSDYTAVSSGALRMKGGGITKSTQKKKKKKPKHDSEHALQDFTTSHSASVNSAAESAQAADPNLAEGPKAVMTGSDEQVNPTPSVDAPTGIVGKTEAERRFLEQKKKRLDERLKREGVKTHKERVEELNRYLSRLSEHHDMPKIGPG